jgi:tetratricopeptide (TPR) repeat protein
LRGLDKPDYLEENRWKSQIDDLLASSYAYMGSAYFSQYEIDRVRLSRDPGLTLDKAYTYSSLAVKLDPKSDFAQFHLGLVFCARNSIDEALHSLARAVVLKGAFLDIAKENLESVYKSINQGSSDGLGELLEQARIDLAKEKPSSL